MNKPKVKKILFILSSIYVGTLLASTIIINSVIPTFQEVGHIEKGCYSSFRFLPYIECNGFIGHQVIKVILNMPYQLGFVPILTFMLFVTLDPWFLFGIIYTLLIWAPIIYFFWILFLYYKKDFMRYNSTENPNKNLISKEDSVQK